MAIWGTNGLLSLLRQLTVASNPPSATDSEIDRWFPSAKNEGCWITSCLDDTYNCIAWAAGESNRYWWPVVAQNAYWPPGVPYKETLPAFVQAFGTIGYKAWRWGRKGNGRLRRGVEKIAIYVDDNGVPTHAARQLPNGRWVSKLGPWKDVEHLTTAALAGRHPAYGTVAKYLWRNRRPLPPIPASRCMAGNIKICKAITGRCPP
jgi:hypothetical protein